MIQQHSVRYSWQLVALVPPHVYGVVPGLWEFSFLNFQTDDLLTTVYTYEYEYRVPFFRGDRRRQQIRTPHVCPPYCRMNCCSAWKWVPDTAHECRRMMIPACQQKH